MKLQKLIDTIRTETDDQPLKQLTSAAAKQQQLVVQGEELLDHFVQVARAAGYSWTQIGDVLGISKQAIQQRHSGSPGLFRWLKDALGGTFTNLINRFSREARQAMVLAQEEARQLNHSYIGTEHLLLGILAQSRGAGALTLATLDIDLDQARADVVDTVGTTTGSGRTGNLPFNREAKHVLEVSLREAANLGHSYLGTEHILLAMIADGPNVAISTLARQALQPETLHTALLRQLEHQD